MPKRGWFGMRRGGRWVRALALGPRHNRHMPAGAPTVNFYPMRLGPRASMAQVLPLVPARVGHAPAGGALTFAWDIGTLFPAASARRLSSDAINGRCLDISKSTVDRTWASVCGYSITLDPLTTHGPIVEKPEANGRHGGRIVEGPLARRAPGMVYQRLVESLTDDRRIVQLRLVVMGGRILFTYAKWRPYGNWFRGTELTLPRPTEEFISADEQTLILGFAQALGLDYGELDTLRDLDGRLYVIDANRTPSLPKALPADAAAEAFGLQAEALAGLLAARSGVGQAVPAS